MHRQVLVAQWKELLVYNIIEVFQLVCQSHSHYFLHFNCAFSVMEIGWVFVLFDKFVTFVHKVKNMGVG